MAARPAGGYSTADGRPVPGVTTICGMLNKPALVGWAGKTCTEAAWRIGRELLPMPKWTAILYPGRDKAAEAGTLVHELFESLLRGLPLPEIPDTDVGRAAQQGYENAKHWVESSALSIEPYEQPLVCEDYGFGGTPDALAIKGDEWYLADWKTGGIYAEQIVQLSAYKHLLEKHEKVSIKGCHLVRFHRDHGDFAHHYFAEDALEMGWEVFRRLLEIHPMLAKLEKRVK